MHSIKLATPQFRIYTHYATGTIKRPGLPLHISAHGYGNSHAEAIAEALQLTANVQTE